MVGLLTAVNRGLVGMEGAEEGVTNEDLWRKLGTMWDLERLQEAVRSPLFRLGSLGKVLICFPEL